MFTSHVFRFPEPQRSRASCFGLGRVGVSNRAEPAENRCALRRHRLGRHTRNPSSDSHGRLRLGVDLFGRASRSRIFGPITWKFLHFSPLTSRSLVLQRFDDAHVRSIILTTNQPFVPTGPEIQEARLLFFLWTRAPFPWLFYSHSRPSSMFPCPDSTTDLRTGDSIVLEMPRFF